MAIQITNNNNTLDIDFDGNGDQYSVYKTNVTLEKSGDYVVIVDSGRVPAKEYKVLYSNVTVPANTDADDLYSILLGYINTTSGGGGGGDASSANQITQIARQDTIIGHVDEIEDKLDSIDGKDFATSTKQEDIKTKLDTETVISNSSRVTLNEILEEIKITNKLLRKIYNPE
jgi:hypothetical protein